MLSVHTSPLEQPGTGDAGGMNVYVVELATGLARRGVEVEIFTRATSSQHPDHPVELAAGVSVQHVLAGPLAGLSKEDLPGQLCAFTAGVMRAGAFAGPDHYDIVHSHYWLSGQVGWLVADRWNVPLVHTMHTMAKVKNAALADGDTPEPPGREIGEEQVVAAADRLIANTVEEARDLVELYGADPRLVQVVPPGVDLQMFTPPPHGKHAVRAQLGLPPEAAVLLFAGRIQPLKAPDVLVRAAAEMLTRDPSLRGRLVVAIIGGPSGSGLARPTELLDLARSLGLVSVPGVPDVVRFQPPVARERLADWYRAADVVVVPSHSESRSRRRPAAPRWWRPGSAACRRLSATADRGCWWRATTLDGGPTCSPDCSPTRLRWPRWPMEPERMPTRSVGTGAWTPFWTSTAGPATSASPSWNQRSPTVPRERAGARRSAGRGLGHRPADPRGGPRCRRASDRHPVRTRATAGRDRRSAARQHPPCRPGLGARR
jgi:D-inositol-3-phosphate glycosyltransferase